MAYTIRRSDGTVLCTIQDGTINTTSSSLGLPGRNKSSYGEILDTNFVKQLESFASASPPPNPLRGQLWFNTTSGVLCVCPADGTLVASNWITLTSTANGSITTGNITSNGNISANNFTASGNIIGDTISVRLANVSATLTTSAANITTANIATGTISSLTTGAATTAGTMTGSYTVVGNSTGNAMFFQTGNITFTSSSVNGIKCDNYMYANGVSFNPAGTYTNSNVYAYLNGGTFTGNIFPSKVTTSELAGGGVISGAWTLAAGARLQATYADLAERFEADNIYEQGTVVELGGAKEITAVIEELSDKVFGVISSTAAYMMNSMAGSDETHPPVAISGRVPVKVTGKVRKGDRLVSAGGGIARAANKGEATSFNTIGRSLTDKTTDGLGEVTAIVIIN